MTLNQIAEIISYIATLFIIISYCCRTVWLRVFQIVGGAANLMFGYMILESAPSARSIIIANIIYLIINVVQLCRELDREEKIC